MQTRPNRTHYPSFFFFFVLLLSPIKSGRRKAAMQSSIGLLYSPTSSSSSLLLCWGRREGRFWVVGDDNVSIAQGFCCGAAAPASIACRRFQWDNVGDEVHFFCSECGFSFFYFVCDDGILRICGLCWIFLICFCVDGACPARFFASLRFSSCSSLTLKLCKISL